MAKQHYLIPARLTKKLPALRNLSWYLEAVIVKSLVRLMQAMPPERAARLTTVLFRSLKPLLPFTAKIRGNLMVAFPEKDKREIERLTRNICGNLGNAVVDLALAERIWAERDERIEYVMEDGIDLRDYRGRPSVMITAHMGAFQLALLFAKHHNMRITSVYAPEKNPYLRDFLFRLRSGLQCHFISRDGCMRGLTRELRQGHMLGLASDTRIGGDGDRVSFFGVPTLANTAAARLALRHNCDFRPVRAERLPGMRFRITFYRAIRPSDPSASVPEQARQMTQTLFEHFEAWIRDTPDQWLCYGRRWPHEAYTDALPFAGNHNKA